MTRRRESADVLSYKLKVESQATVLRHYLKWRFKRKMATQCDIEGCQFHTDPLLWNGQRFGLILDHRNGNHKDNRPENLQLLCPMCDSQQPTRGGKNKGRVQNQLDQSFELKERGGRKDAVVLLKGQSTSTKQGKLQGTPPE